MHCLSTVQKLCPRLDGVQEPRRKGRHVLQKPSSRDLRRLLGTLRHGLPGAHEHAQSDAEIGSIWIQASVNSALSIEKSPERAKRSRSTHDPGLPGQIRRTRGVTSAKWSETPNMKSNGHDTSTSRVNSHGPVSPSRATQYAEVPREQGRAASDDARDFPAAAGASSAPSGKERDG